MMLTMAEMAEKLDHRIRGDHPDRRTWRRRAGRSVGMGWRNLLRAESNKVNVCVAGENLLSTRGKTTKGVLWLTRSSRPPPSRSEEAGWWLVGAAEVVEGIERLSKSSINRSPPPVVGLDGVSVIEEVIESSPVKSSLQAQRKRWDDTGSSALNHLNRGVDVRNQ